MFGFSAPGESAPLLLGSTGSDIHQEVANTRTMVNKIHNILKSQEGTGSQPQSVGVTHSVPHRTHTYSCLDSEQVGNLDCREIRCPWGTTTSATKSLLRTRRAGREDRWSRTTSHANCSNWRWWNRQDIHRPDGPPRRSDQAAVWRQPTVHPL